MSLSGLQAGLSSWIRGGCMVRFNDLLLLIVVFSSMFAGIFLPGLGDYFQPYPLYLMMFLLFLSFLSIQLEAIGEILKNHWSMTLWLTFFKLVALPGIVYLILRLTCPRFATAGLLLSGVSTGVVAPFISTLVRSNDSLVLLLVVSTSFLVPFTLPVLVKLLLGQTLKLSLFAMIQVLVLIVFVPIMAVEILRRTLPSLLSFLLKKRYPISLGTFAAINLGVFSKYAVYFRQQPMILLKATLVALALGGIYFLLGLASVRKVDAEYRLAAAIGFGNMNNVLIIVFSSHFFGPLEATVAAMYMIPFFGLIFPLRAYERLNWKGSPNP